MITEIPAPDVLARATRTAVSPTQELAAPPPPPSTGTAAAPVTEASQTPLDADAIVKMKKGGISDDLIVSMAQKRGVAKLLPEAMIRMKAAGLSDQSLAQLVQLSPPQ